MSEIYIVQGSAAHLPSLIAESHQPPTDGEMLWTCLRTVERGDRRLIYLLAPLSAIVASAVFTGPAFKLND